jgi:kynurenine formamidase
MAAPDLLAFAKAVATGAIRVVDLTQTLTPEFPTIVLPPEFGQCAPFRMEEVSRYDERGPAWYWNNISVGEHTGTHFDAPIHWISGRDLPDNAVDTIPPANFIAPAVVIDCSREAAADADFVLTVPFVETWEHEHGRIAPGNWVLLRTDWSKKSAADYAGMREDGAHTPGPGPEVVKWHRNYRDRCRAGASLQSALSGAFLHARQGPLRSAMPDQSRSAAAGRDRNIRRTFEDQAGLRQSAAGAGADRCAISDPRLS